MLWNSLTLTCIDIGLALTFNFDFTVKMPNVKFGILISVLTHKYAIHSHVSNGIFSTGILETPDYVTSL